MLQSMMFTICICSNVHYPMFMSITIIIILVIPSTTSTPTTTPEPSYICWDGNPLVMNNSSGEITSPDYPGSYPIHAKCQWHIKVTEGNVVMLTFIELELEEG